MKKSKAQRKREKRQEKKDHIDKVKQDNAQTEFREKVEKFDATQFAAKHLASERLHCKDCYALRETCYLPEGIEFIDEFNGSCSWCENFWADTKEIEHRGEIYTFEQDEDDPLQNVMVVPWAAMWIYIREKPTILKKMYEQHYNVLLGLWDLNEDMDQWYLNMLK